MEGMRISGFSLCEERLSARVPTPAQQQSPFGRSRYLLWGMEFFLTVPRSCCLLKIAQKTQNGLMFS